jgi:hypothetical protein
MTTLCQSVCSAVVPLVATRNEASLPFFVSRMSGALPRLPMI